LYLAAFEGRLDNILMATRKQSELTRVPRSLPPQRAIEFLHQRINAARELSNKRPIDQGLYDAWYTQTLLLLEKAFGEGSSAHDAFINAGGHRRPSSWNPTVEQWEQFLFGTLEDQIIMLESFIGDLNIDLVSSQPTDKKLSAPNSVVTTPDPLATIETVASRFHRIARQLRRRHASRKTLDISDEYDVQDLLHALLLMFFDDVRPEEWTPSYAATSSRMDFLLHKEEIVVEAKMTRESLKQGDLIDQLIVDRARYEKHEGCKTLVCFLYDPDGRINNPTAVISDIENQSGKLQVRVFIQPKH
jgi:REase_DpnII-MboI